MTWIKAHLSLKTGTRPIFRCFHTVPFAIQDKLGRELDRLEEQGVLQMMLDEESVKLVTVNMHRGLYHFYHLLFGVASAPAIFQRTMDSILQGLPFVICYLDDILVSGRTDEDYLKNLEEVLHRLKHQGIKLKREKCLSSRSLWSIWVTGWTPKEYIPQTRKSE